MNSREGSWSLTILDESQQHQAGATLVIAYNHSPDRYPHSVKLSTSYFIHKDAISPTVRGHIPEYCNLGGGKTFLINIADLSR